MHADPWLWEDDTIMLWEDGTWVLLEEGSQNDDELLALGVL